MPIAAELTEVVNPKNAADWLELADRYGLPLVFLFVIMCFIALIGWAFWRAVKPHIDRMLDRHVALIDALTICLQKLTASTDIVNEKLDELAELVKEGDTQCRKATDAARKESREDIRGFYDNSRIERNEMRSEHNTHWTDLRQAIHRITEFLQVRAVREGQLRAEGHPEAGP